MKKFKEWVSTLTEADFEAMAKDLVKQLDETTEKLGQFYKSERFKEVVLSMKKHLETNQQVCDNYYQAFVFSDVTNDEFSMVFEILFRQDFVKLQPLVDNTSIFESEYVIYEGMKFVQLHGQGTALILKRIT